MTKENLDYFLAELTWLSRKYSIVIGGCGCCGSPDLNDLNEKDKNGHYSASDIKGDYAESMGWVPMKPQ